MPFMELTTHHASTLPIPTEDFVNIEHPGIIRDVEKAVASLGGHDSLGEFLHSQDSDRALGLYLSPEDPFRQPIQSTSSQTSNLLLRVILPKRTGRKRKKGSSDPFAFHDPVEGTTTIQHGQPQQLLRSLRDNPQSYSVEAVGSICQDVRFRALPDFQYSITNMPIAKSIKDNLLSFDYEKLKNFKLEDNEGLQPGIDTIPPAPFSSQKAPFQWAFVSFDKPSNTGSKSRPATEVEPLEPKKVESHAPKKPRTEIAPVNDLEQPIPTGPSQVLAAEETLGPALKMVIAKVQDVLASRPVVTRHFLSNHIGASQPIIADAVPYCGYRFSEGPWADTVVRYGFDPKKDPESRHLQTLHFRVRDRKHPTKDAARNKGDLIKESHIFDGVNMPAQGTLFQLCDITDKLLRNIIDTAPPGIECMWYGCGWLNPVVWGKLRLIMKDKLTTLANGLDTDDSYYAPTVAIPNDLALERRAFPAVPATGAAPTSAKQKKMRNDARRLARLGAYRTPLGSGSGDVLPFDAQAEGYDDGPLLEEHNSDNFGSAEEIVREPLQVETGGDDSDMDGIEQQHIEDVATLDQASLRDTDMMETTSTGLDSSVIVNDASGDHTGKESPECEAQ